jgi:hypothetical protein
MINQANLGVCPWLRGIHRVSPWKYSPRTHDPNAWPWDPLVGDNRDSGPWHLEPCEAMVGSLMRSRFINKYNLDWWNGGGEDRLRYLATKDRE